MNHKTLLVSLLMLGCLAARSQGNFATVHVYRGGFSSKEALAFRFFIDDSLATAALKPSSVHTFYCRPGTTKFSTGGNVELTLNLEIGLTYFIEFKYKGAQELRQVSKNEALADLYTINENLKVLVKPEATETLTNEGNNSEVAHVFPASSTFLYVPRDGQIQPWDILVTDSLVVGLGDYTRLSDDKFLRNAFVGDERLQMWYFKTDNRWRGEIRTDKGNIIATIGQYGGMAYDIILPDGTTYDWIKISDEEWAYKKGDSIVLRSGITKVGRRRGVNINWQGPDRPVVVLLGALERGFVTIEIQILKKASFSMFLLGGE